MPRSQYDQLIFGGRIEPIHRSVATFVSLMSPHGIPIFDDPVPSHVDFKTDKSKSYQVKNR
jgi:hypothetical protein